MSKTEYHFDIKCVLFGHLWQKKNGKVVCKRCGSVQ
jgi:hypothetical protein